MVGRSRVLATVFVLAVIVGCTSSTPRKVEAPALPKDGFYVDVANMASALRDLPSEELRDQLRDWALYAALGKVGIGADAVAQATHNMAPVRRRYLEELFSYEYGYGRHAILPDGRVVAIVDENDPHPMATVGRLADRARRESGEQTPAVLVFTFVPDLPHGRLVVVKKDAVTRDKIFGPEYGFVDRIVSDQKSLSDWVDASDDLVSAEIVDGGVRLGGRRFADHRTLGLGLTDLAVLYQAHAELAQARLDKKANPAGHPKEVPDAPGFSLDPSDDSPFSKALVEVRVEDDPCGSLQEALREAEATKTVKRPADALLASEQSALFIASTPGIWDRKSSCSPWMESLEDESRERVIAALVGYESKRGVRQCARYDGPLEGTRVGMNLFYTDLLAKLWGFDFHHSAPVLGMPGMVVIPRAGIQPAYRREAIERSQTRTWFGVNTEAVSRSPGERTVLLDPIGTRVFAAGRATGSWGNTEVQPSEPERLTMLWWDRHYATLATFEPQYQMQNEIMKWSLILSVLQAQHKMDYLLSLKTDRGAFTFDTWLAAEGARLRYPHPIAVLPRKAWLSPSRECLPVLASYTFNQSLFFTGGVTLGGEQALKKSAVFDKTLPPAVRVAPSSETITQSMLGRPVPRYRGQGAVEIVPTERTQMREAETTISLGKTTSVARNPSRAHLAIELQSRAGPVGTFTQEQTGTGFSLRWEKGQVENEVAFSQMASRNARSFAPGMAARTNRPPIELDGRLLPTTLVDERGKLTEVKLQLAGMRDDASAPVKSVGDLLSSSVAEAKDASAVFEQHDWQGLRPFKAASNADVRAGWQRLLSTRGPPDGSRSTMLRGLGPDGTDLKVYLSSKDNTLWIQRPPRAAEWWQNVDRETKLSTTDLDVIRGAITKGRTEVALHPLPFDPTTEALPANLTAADAARARTRLADEADFRLREGEPSQAASLYKLYRERYRDADPALLLREGLAQLQSGHGADGLAEFQKASADLAAAGRRPPEAVRIALEELTRSPSFGGAARVLLARLGYASEAQRAIASTIAVEANGVGLSARAPVASRSIRPMSLSERKALAADPRGHMPDLIYQSELPFNSVDYELEPHENLVELALNADYDFREATGAAEYAYRPDVLEESVAGSGSRRYERVHDGVKSPASSPKRPLRVLLVRNCDENRDGVVTDAERQRCHQP